MTLPKQINTKQSQSFVETNRGNVARRVKIEEPGLNIAGKITEVDIDSTSWTALPSTPLENRNAIAIRNSSDLEIKINYDNTESGYVGMPISVGEERSYNITDNIIIYGKSQAGSSKTLIIEELS